jgi:hypothetical protein
MSQIQTENDDNRSIATSDFVQPDRVPHNYGNDSDIKALKLMIANLEVFLLGIIN